MGPVSQVGLGSGVMGQKQKATKCPEEGVLWSLLEPEFTDRGHTTGRGLQGALPVGPTLPPATALG